MKHPASNAVNIRRSRNGWRSTSSLYLAFLCALIVLGLGSLPAKAQVSREYQLKAVFLYNFAQFTDWPESPFADKKSPIFIGVLGKGTLRPIGELCEIIEENGLQLVLAGYLCLRRQAAKPKDN